MISTRNLEGPYEEQGKRRSPAIPCCEDDLYPASLMGLEVT